MAIDPICGMTVDPATAAGRHDYDGKTFWFCSQQCLDKFRADPARYAKPSPVMTGKALTSRKPLPMMNAPATSEPAAGEIDPVCGMTVSPNSAAGSYSYQGKTYYFCSRSCLTRFKADPVSYLSKAAGSGSGSATSPRRQ